MTYEANRRVETSARTFEIVERLSGVEHAGVSELANELGMSKGIVHNHLSTLRELGYVRKIGDGYQLTPELLAIGFEARSNAPLYRFGTEICSGFAEQLDVGVLLTQSAGGSCIVIDSHHVPEQVDAAVGSSLPVLGSIVGLVIHAVENRETSDVGESTTYDVEQIGTDLETDGCSVGPLSTEVPAACVAVPIVGDDGDCHGSVGVVPSDARQEEELEQLTAEAVSLRNRIESRFDSGWTGERSFTTEKHTWVG